MMLTFQVSAGHMPWHTVAGPPSLELCRQLEIAIDQTKAHCTARGEAPNRKLRITADWNNLTALMPGGFPLMRGVALRIARAGRHIVPSIRGDWVRKNIPDEILCDSCAGRGCGLCMDIGLSSRGLHFVTELGDPLWTTTLLHRAARRVLLGDAEFSADIQDNVLRENLHVIPAPCRDTVGSLGDWIPRTAIAAAAAIIRQQFGTTDNMTLVHYVNAQQVLTTAWSEFPGVAPWMLVALMQLQILQPHPDQVAMANILAGGGDGGAAALPYGDAPPLPAVSKSPRHREPRRVQID